LFKLCAWQSFCITSFHVLFRLPLGLEPSTSYSIHFFTQSVSSFHSTCPYHRNLFCCSINIISSTPSLSLNSLLGTLSFTLTLHIHLTILTTTTTFDLFKTGFCHSKRSEWDNLRYSQARCLGFCCTTNSQINDFNNFSTAFSKKKSRKPYSEVRMQLAEDIPDLIQAQMKGRPIAHIRDTCTLWYNRQTITFLQHAALCFVKLYIINTMHKLTWTL